MIQNYTIHNFKVHRDTSIDLSPLTIFTGVNSAGKSSVFQTMLMLRESLQKRHSLDVLDLRGRSFDIDGKALELINWGIEDINTLQISLMLEGGNRYRFTYAYPIGTAGNPDVLRIQEGATRYEEDVLEKACALFNDNFQYISAFRSGPQSSYWISTDAQEHNQVSGEMGRGEYAVMQYVLHHTSDIQIQSMKHPTEPSLLVQDQVQAWMNEITAGVKINVIDKGNEFKLNFGYATQGGNNRYASALNSGYGVGYVFSVVVALLTSKPGALIIIENPEAHIHPAAQSAIMRLIANASANGVQVILETHSDHIINAALVAIKKEVLAKEALTVYYFTRQEETLASEPIKLTIGRDCRIKKAPKGFFDQMTSDLEVLFGLH